MQKTIPYGTIFSMKIINSLQNPLVKHVVGLQTSKLRKSAQQFSAEGLRTLQTLLAPTSKFKLVSLFCTQQTADLANQLAPFDQLVCVTDQIMQKISTSQTPSQLLAIFEKPQASTFDLLSSGLVLAQIADPGNMGTLVRTAAAMGFNSVVIIEGCDVWSPKAIQASAGTIAQLQIFELSWQDLLAHKKDLKLCALVVAGGSKPSDLDLKKSLIIVGNEANGLPAAWQNDCEQLMTIPMPGHTESLNAAVAGSIALYLAANFKV